MSGAALDLQDAVFTALKDYGPLTSALGGAKIHDLTPAALPFPYITFGQADVYDWSADQGAGAEVIYTLHVWSKYRGRKELLLLMGHVRDRLEDELTLSAHQLVNHQLESTEIRYDDDLDGDTDDDDDLDEDEHIVM